MKVKKLILAVAIVFFILLLLLQLTTACPRNLRCSNFTSMDKRSDCNYIWSRTSGQERQQAICILWDQNYYFPEHNHTRYQDAQANFTFSPKEIEASRFILFGKVIIFLLFNYFLFSILTRTSFAKKCLTAG